MSSTLIGILGVAALFAAILWKSISAGKAVESAKHEKDRADAYKEEMGRVRRASEARVDAERDARGGMLDDKWTRPD